MGLQFYQEMDSIQSSLHLSNHSEASIWYLWIDMTTFGLGNMNIFSSLWKRPPEKTIWNLGSMHEWGVWIGWDRWSNQNHLNNHFHTLALCVISLWFAWMCVIVAEMGAIGGTYIAQQSHTFGHFLAQSLIWFFWHSINHSGTHCLHINIFAGK